MADKTNYGNLGKSVNLSSAGQSLFGDEISQKSQTSSNQGGSMTLWSALRNGSGPKSGEAIVRRLEAAVHQAGLTDAHYLAMVHMWKSLPLKSENEVRAQIAFNNRQRDERFQGFDLGNSKPAQKVDRNKEMLIDAVNRIRAHLQNKEDLSWGSLAQCSVFQGLVKDIIDDVNKTMPTVREMVMSKFLCNLIPFDTAEAMMVKRHKCANRSLSSFKAFAKKQSQGDIVNGNKITSDGVTFDFQGKVPDIKKFMIDEGGSLIDSNDADYNLNAANYPDFRLLLQAPEVRRNKNNPDMIRARVARVAGLMGGVIAAAGGTFSGFDDVTKDSPFTTMYYERLRMLRSSLRNLIRIIWGSSGGADTRSQLKSYSKTVNVANQAIF